MSKTIPSAKGTGPIHSFDIEETVCYARLLKSLVEGLHRPPGPLFSGGPEPESVYLCALLSGSTEDIFGLSFNPDVFELDHLRPIIPKAFLQPRSPKSPEELAERLKALRSEDRLPPYLDLDRIRGLITDRGPTGIAFRLIKRAFREFWTSVLSEEIPRICERHETVYLKICPRCLESKEFLPWTEEEGKERPIPQAYETAVEILNDPVLCAARLRSAFEREVKSLSSVFLALMVLERIYDEERGEWRHFLSVEDSGPEPKVLLDPDFYRAAECFVAYVLLEVYKIHPEPWIFGEYAERFPGYSGSPEPKSFSAFLLRIVEGRSREPAYPSLGRLTALFPWPPWP